LRTIRFPNWVGTTDVVTVQLNDFDQSVGDSNRG
jgi:translation initiation factor IF-1